MKLRAVLVGILAVLIAAATAQAQDLNSSTIVRDENMITLSRALDIAYNNNLEIKQAQSDKYISSEKLNEAVAGGRFTLGLSGNVVQTVGGSSVSLPLHYHLPAVVMNGATPLISVNPLTGATSAVVAGNAISQNVDFSSKLQTSLGFVVKQPIWTVGRIKKNIQLNRNGLMSSDYGVRTKRLDISLKVKQAYYQFLLAQEFLSVSENTLSQAEAHYEAAKAKFDAGATPRFDLIRAEVDVASAREDVTTARKSVDLARMALNNVMGIDVNAPTKAMAPETSGNITLKIDELTSLALANRPEIKQLRLGQDSAFLGARMSRLLPTVGFQGTYALNSSGSAFGQQDTWQLVVAADIPMYDSGTAKAKVRQALGTREKLRQTEAQLRDGIRLQVNEAYLSLQEAQARQITSAAIMAVAEEAVRMAETGYKEGVTTNLDVIDAQHGLNGARLNAAQARFDCETAEAKLLNAVGLDNIQELNAAGK